MKDIVAFAEQAVGDTSPLIGHAEADWTTLREVHQETIAWAPELSRMWADALYGHAQTAPFVERLNRSDHEQSFAVWYEKLVCGVPGEVFWAETCMIGLYHAVSGVHNRHVIAMVSAVEQAFLERCVRSFEVDRALEVYGAFKRLMGVACSLMVDSYLEALMLGMTEIGMNERLVNTIRRVAIRRMIDRARQSLPLIDWSEALSVGIASIDAQHKRLVELLNSLHDSRAQGKGNEILKGILNELTEYTVEHFAYEEGMMKDHGYADFEAHKQAHDALTKQVAELNEQFQAGNAKLSGDLFKFLRSWLNGHIRGTDKLYSAHMRERGVD